MNCQKLLSFFIILSLLFIGCSKDDESTGSSTSYTDLSGSLSGTLSKSAGPYRITSDVYVPEDSTLTIEAGIEIHFNGFYSLTVSGRMLAIGSPTNYILFTSTPDNNSTDRGDWEGIVFNNPDQTSIMEFCNVRDGGLFVDYEEDVRGAIHCVNSSPVIRKCILSDNGYNAVYTRDNAAPLIDGCTMTNNAFSGVVCDTLAKPLIRNCIIVTNDDYGVFAVLNSQAAPRIEYCNIWDNITTDIFGVDITGFPGLFALDPEFADPSGDYQLLSHSPCIDAGDQNSIIDPDGTIRDLGAYFYDQSNPSEIRNALSGTITLEHSPYLITSSIWVDAGDTLVIEPGVEFRINAETNLRFSFSIYGTLISEGTSSNPIVFTSSKDVPAKGDWEALYFRENTESSVLSYTNVHYTSEVIFVSDIAVENCVFDNIEYDVIAVDCSPQFENCVFSNMGFAGLTCYYYATPVVKHCVFTGSQGYGMWCQDYSSPVITNNLIYGNMSSGIRASIFSYPQIVNNTIADNGYYAVWLTGNSDAYLKNNIFSMNEKGGIVCAFSSIPDMLYNDSYGHSFDGENTNFDNTPADIGVWTTTNANSDSCDMCFNISFDPLLSDDSQFTLSAGSPCAGAGLDDTGAATDMGAYGGPEGSWTPPAVENCNAPGLVVNESRFIKLKL